MNRVLLTFLLLLGVLSACTRQESEISPTRGSVTAYVAESHAVLMQREADEFHRLYEAAQVTLLSSTTREAIVHLLNDSVRIIITDRPLNAEEQGIVKQHDIRLTETKIAEDALALVVHQQNPLQEMRRATLAGIVRREITGWNQVAGSKWSGPIEFVFTGRNSGAYELLTRKFLQIDEVVPTIVVNTQKEVLDYIASHPAAFGVVSAACFYSVTRPQGVVDSTTVLRTLAFERQDTTVTSQFVKLHPANVHRGFYPLHYGVYIYTSSSPSRDAGPEVGFASFVASYPGQKIIQDAGLVPATMPIRLVQINED
ncbi:MAG: substrate-binding domain-containing protein [candidate division KSB1 bacterium]|nr:substrate-binding domain-containing protein [candidate division KSB1 bacterium]MDZ7369055.1 substrate-binding domain-containing protein [candidate division KSB1 bacterium]MDZ7407280.1 substrate-binding domain-containing protein [candidate division KSB1 bacterium]